VRWAVSESLRHVQSYRPSLKIAPRSDLGFIYGVLRDLFRNQRRDLAGILTKLAMLEVRFQREYLQEEEINWVQCFDTNTDLFDRVTTTSPDDLADSLTEDDTIAFQKLCPQNVLREDSNLRVINRRWDRLCQAIQKILIVDDALRPLLADLAEVNFRTLLFSNC